MTIRALLDGSLETFLAEALGAPVVAAEDVSRGGGAAVLRLGLADGRAAALKMHRSAAKHRSELAAYRFWGPALAPRVPRLLAARHDAAPAIVLDWRPGRVDPPADDRLAPRLHRQAGAWLARLQRLPLPQADPLPLAEAYRKRAAAWTARAEGRLPAATLRTVRAELDAACAALAGRSRVPCHRDLGPWNWLAHEGRLEAVIDFEHARPDVAEVDLARLACWSWPERPALRAAFLDGYRSAGGPADPEAPWIAGLELLEALGTVVWAARQRDAALEAAGRRALDRRLESTR